MVGYSSDRFYREWRFAIDTDFTDQNGEPFVYADNGKQEWGDELMRLPFASAPTLAAINHDHSVLAVAVEDVIYLYEAKSLSFKEIACLRGHISRVDGIAFQPGHPDTLVSCAMNYYGGSVPAKPTIIFWDLKNENNNINLGDKEVHELAKDAGGTIAKCLESRGLQVDTDNERQLRKGVELPIRQALARANVARQVKLHGRLTRSFDSQNFSNSGKYLIYMPGDTPRSNGSDQWDVKIYSMDSNKDVLTLSGHRDSIMWTGYDKADKYIGTVAWDKTSRIWDATTGELKYTFPSQGQNWTGAFSSNGDRFAFTCGDGNVAVYSLANGDELIKHNFGVGWQRTLAWSPRHDNLLAIGGRGTGDLRLFDIQSKQTVQHRKLSTERAKTDEAHRRFIASYLETYHAKFVDNGSKLVFFTTGDGSAEVYDLGDRNRKWRFARAGTDSYPNDVDSEPDREVTSRGGFDIEVWEDVQSSNITIATVDGDAVRIWKLGSGK